MGRTELWRRELQNIFAASFGHEQSTKSRPAFAPEIRKMYEERGRYREVGSGITLLKSKGMRKLLKLVAEVGRSVLLQT